MKTIIQYRPNTQYTPAFILLTLLLLFNWTTLSAYERKELLPPDLDIIIRISDSTALLKAIETSPMGQLWNSPIMNGFLNNGSLGDALISDFTGIDPGIPGNGTIFRLEKKSLSLLKGEIVFGLNYKDPKGFYLLTRMNSADFTKGIAVDHILDKLKKETIISKETLFRGVPIHEETIDGDQSKLPSLQTCYQNTLINTPDKEWLEQSIIRLKESPPTESKGEPTIDITFSGNFIRKWLKEKWMGPIPNPQDFPQITTAAENMIDGLGLSHLEYVHFSLSMKSNELESTLKINGPTEKKGIFTLINKQPVPLNYHLNYVPEDIFSYHVQGWDLAAFWQELPSIFKGFDPSSNDKYQEGISNLSKMLKVDLSRELFSNLEPLMVTYSKIIGIAPQTLYAFQLRDPELTSKFLEKLFAENSFFRLMMQDAIQVDTFATHKIYLLTLPETPTLFPEDNKDQQKEPIIFNTTALTVTGDTLIAGNEEMIRAYLQATISNNEPPSFYNSPVYQSMIRKIPDEATSYSIFNMSLYVRQLASIIEKFNKMDTSEPSEPLKPHDQSHVSHFLANLKFEKLPPSDTLAEYFYHGISYITTGNKEIIIKATLFYPTIKK